MNKMKEREMQKKTFGIYITENLKYRVGHATSTERGAELTFRVLTIYQHWCVPIQTGKVNNLKLLKSALSPESYVMVIR